MRNRYTILIFPFFCASNGAHQFFVIIQQWEDYCLFTWNSKLDCKFATNNEKIKLIGKKTGKMQTNSRIEIITNEKGCVHNDFLGEANPCSPESNARIFVVIMDKQRKAAHYSLLLKILINLKSEFNFQLFNASPSNGARVLSTFNFIIAIFLFYFSLHIFFVSSKNLLKSVLTINWFLRKNGHKSSVMLGVAAYWRGL